VLESTFSSAVDFSTRGPALTASFVLVVPSVVDGGFAGLFPNNGVTGNAGRLDGFPENVLN